MSRLTVEAGRSARLKLPTANSPDPNQATAAPQRFSTIGLPCSLIAWCSTFCLLTSSDQWPLPAWKIRFHNRNDYSGRSTAAWKFSSTHFPPRRIITCQHASCGGEGATNRYSESALVICCTNAGFIVVFYCPCAIHGIWHMWPGLVASGEGGVTHHGRIIGCGICDSAGLWSLDTGCTRTTLPGLPLFFCHWLPTVDALRCAHICDLIRGPTRPYLLNCLPSLGLHI